MERYPTSEEKHGGQKRSRALWRKMLSRREGFQRTSDEGGQQGRPHWQWELELTFSLVRDPRCWERLKTGREGDDTGWDGGVASPTPWTWAWASSRRWGRTGKPEVLHSMGSKRVGHNFVTEPQQTILNTSHVLAIPHHNSLRGGIIHLHFTNEDTGALKGEVTCPNKIADEGRARTQHSVSYTKAFYLN